MVKSTFWTDPELLSWPREKRWTWQGLWAIAEDSGCLEDSTFGWKLQLWPSPVDQDITEELLNRWRDEWVESGKLIPYESSGKPFLFIARFHHHENPRNPGSPDLPLPAWIRWASHSTDPRKGSYVEDPNGLEVLQALYNGTTTVPVLPCPVLPCPALSSPALTSPGNDSESGVNPIDEHPDFSAFWDEYPKKVDRLGAAAAYKQVRERHSAEDLLGAIGRYEEQTEIRFLQRPADFLASVDPWVKDFQQYERSASRMFSR